MNRFNLARADERQVLPHSPGSALAEGFHYCSWRSIDIGAIEPSWLALAHRASTPNAFFEMGFLLPSLAIFDPEGSVTLALLVDEGELRGLMPLIDRESYHGRATPHRSSWLHANMFCGAPLIEKGYEEAFWSAFLLATDRNPGTAWFLNLPQMPLHCAATRVLRKTCRREGRPLQIVHRHFRAILNTGTTPQDYLSQAMPAKSRKELRRQRRRLEELGAVEIVRTRSCTGLVRWIDDFLVLEAKGWKGAGGSSLASDTHTAALFLAAMRRIAEEGRLERLTLTLDGRPIAMLATLLAPPGSFAFKTAFDEDYARFSPGMQLQVENLALLEDHALEWCDSCAAQGHPMIERIWSERHEVVSLSIAVGRGWRRWVGALWARAEAWRMERRQ
ncbi:GNAT family N-acetyltransferase [Qipengyuania sp. XHP0207]|uniref:GNAT family N-acetyltransferase n=1 Tax=Qipengyuania sp. XHP0207 TaxID=3038078 RepID=UPI00241DBC69|nr:GNAT family N-acetyltransferase [Qipengyuania sp. XHP0207]MDG5748807.1 GNAT family N-acetyltransferase [Qipengyuania sp. XHP0207]